MAKTKQELAPRYEQSAAPYGRKLNNRGRALVHDALGRLMAGGDMAATVGTHGRNFPDQLAHELLESPLASLLRIDAATPSDEGEEAKGAAAQGTTNIGALYLLAMQGANKQAEPKVIEGTIGVQPKLSDW